MLLKEIPGGWTYDGTVEPLKPIVNPMCLKRTAFWKSPEFITSKKQLPVFVKYKHDINLTRFFATFRH